MPRYAPNKMSPAVKRRYFELIRVRVLRGEAARQVGVSLSCGSLWFIEAGSVPALELTPINSRFLSQEDRIGIADGLARGEPVKEIAGRIGKSFHSLYREIARNRKPEGSYQPYYAHNQAHVRRRRPQAADLRDRACAAVAVKLGQRWWREEGEQQQQQGGGGSKGATTTGSSRGGGRV